VTEIDVRWHHVAVFTPSEDLNFKVTVYYYLAPKVCVARKLFEEEHPGKQVIKIFSLGVDNYKVSREKYRALYQIYEALQEGIPTSKSPWRA
jgi:hypothetical protein